MSVINTQLVVYVASEMPEDNTGVVGGVIDSGVRASYDDLVSSNQIIIYSASGEDTSQTLTLAGRSVGGAPISETMSLNGTTHVTSSYTYDRILKAYLDTVAVGVVTVSGNSVNNITDIPVGESGFRRPFYNATASVNEARVYYEKIFVKNNNPITFLTEAKIVEVPNTGLASKIAFGLEDTKQADQTISNRLAVPTGVTGGYGNGPSGIINDELLTEDYQGVWLQLNLDVGEVAINSFYEVQISGITV